jgi:cell fate (sporulation/competence/biofilm development) regulator YmcA (YheA/YmcA/DUF963 family)
MDMNLINKLLLDEKIEQLIEEYYIETMDNISDYILAVYLLNAIQIIEDIVDELKQPQEEVVYLINVSSDLN